MYGHTRDTMGGTTGGTTGDTTGGTMGDTTDDTTDDTTFKAVISAPVALRQLVQRIEKVLKDVVFTVTDGRTDPNGFSGLRVNSIDSTTICLVNAQMSADVSGNGNFCVAAKDLLTFLKAIDSASVLTITGGRALDNIVLVAEERGGSKVRRYTLRRTARDPEEVSLNDMVTEHQMHIPTAEIAKYLGLCQQQKYPVVEFCLQHVPCGAGRVDKYLTMSATDDIGGGAQETYVDWDVTDTSTMNASGERPAAGVSGEPPDDAPVIYREQFNREFLYRFCSNLDTPMVKIGFCGRDKPIIVNFELGVEDSHVRFVLASSAVE